MMWMRKYRVIVVGSSTEYSFDVSNLHCKFEIHKATKDKPGYSQIGIYNLNTTTEDAIVSNGKKVIVEAGYENGDYGMIFSGKIIQPLRMKADNVTRVLVLICQDGDEYLNSSFTAKTLSSGASQKDIIDAVTTGNDVSLGFVTDKLAETVLSRGKVLFGKSASYLTQIANTINAQMYIEDDEINIVAAEDYAKTEAVELNPRTGLIGTPEQTDDGVSCECLINPRIKLNTQIYINSNLVTPKQVADGETKWKEPNEDGIYRIVKLDVTGDTRGDDWTMKIEAVTQSGKVPAGLTGDETRLWR